MIVTVCSGTATNSAPAPDNGNCINPWEGKAFYQHIGDPKETCPQRGYCYVSCDSDVSDKKKARYRNRCYSNQACEGL